MRTYRQRHKRKMNAASRDRVKRGRKAKKKGRAWSNRSKRRCNSRGKEKVIARKLLKRKRERGLRQYERG